MKKIIAFVIFFVSLNIVTAQENKTSYPVYSGKDLGLTYTPTAATFKIWAPTATAAKLNLYKSDLGGYCNSFYRDESRSQWCLVSYCTRKS